MKIIDGKAIANQIKLEIAEEVKQLTAKGKKQPNLAVVMVGDNGASATYVGAKVKACKQVGFQSTDIHLPEETSEQELLNTIDDLNHDPDVDGFIVQLPLPGHIDENKIINRIDPTKDVDGFHPENIGRMALGLPSFLAATPAGIIELLKRSNIETWGKHVVVLGRSNIVGTPISILLSRKSEYGNATVTLCHSRTKNLKELCLQADIIIAAIGKMHFVSADMVKEGAVVIDVGIHRVKSDKTKSGWKLHGDVDFDAVASKCSYITPVPGGVGPMTIISLLQNTLQAAKTK